jgi:hypothetical protein
MACRCVKQAPGIIIVEDDFLFAPDFYEYFHFVAPMLVCSRLFRWH